MARARNLKPGFFKNEDLAECSPWARLCFAGLWLLADREGRLEDRPKRIKGELFAYDSVEVESLLCELARHRFIIRYEIEGERFIQVSKFAEHQTPHYSEKPSVIKPPGFLESGPHEDPPDSKSTPRKEAASRGGRNPLNPSSLNPSSPNPPTTVGDAPPASPPATRGTRLPKDWQLPKPWGEWALAEFPQWRPDKVRTEGEKFRDHWCAKTGKDATSLDWLARWRNWCRSDIAHRDDPKPNGAQLLSFRERDAELAKAQADAWMGSAKPQKADPNTLDLEATDAARLSLG